MRARFDREREQGRADLRDALAVLTPEQQAMAWEMTARRGPGARDTRFRPGREGRPRSDRERAPRRQRFRM
jgi:hypothetical protein